MRVERLRAKFEIDLKWTHFPLHPGTPDEGLTLEQLFAGRHIDVAASKASMTRLMAEEGLEYGDRTMTYNSRLAQEMATWVQSEKRVDAIHDALFRAYFVDRLNLAKISVLVRIAERLGLDGQKAREILEARTWKEAVDADWQRSHQLGVSGVPTFLIGENVVVGAQPYEVLEQLVVKAGRTQDSKSKG